MEVAGVFAASKIVVAPILSFAINIAGSSLKEEVLSFFGLEKKMDKLRNSLLNIQAVVKAAEDRQFQDDFVRMWLERLEGVAFDAADIIDLFQTEGCILEERRNSSKFHLPLTIPFLSKSRYKKKFKEILKNLDEINHDRIKFNLGVGLEDYGRPIVEDRMSISYVDKTTVLGREKERIEILKILSSKGESKLVIVPIIGMGGLGKTTLAQLVYNDDWTTSTFDVDCRFWVCVGHKFSWVSIIKKMMKSHLKELLSDDLSPDDIVETFRSFLTSKRFILVLDDVWTTDYIKHWGPLLKLLELGLPGSKVLVTTRDHKVAKILKTQPFLLQLLPDDKCYQLFQEIAFADDDVPSLLRRDLENMGKEIVNKCKGLPLALKAMAGLLRADVDKNRWRMVLNSSTWDLEDQVIQTALKLSYDGLPHHLKHCFSYCSILPKSFIFEKTTVVKMWMAEGLILSKKEDQEQTGSGYFDILLLKCFFQRYDLENQERYTMHDLMHDLALSVSIPYCYQLKDRECCDLPTNCRYMSVVCNVEQASRHLINSCKKLRTLIFLGDQVKFAPGTAKKLWDSLKFIRVLDLSSTSLLEVPSSVAELKLLRYLDVSNSGISKLPNSICKLYNLQTLRLLGCPLLLTLPYDLSHLVNLQHLELECVFWQNCTALPPWMGSLVLLQNLHAYHVRAERGRGVQELQNLNCLTGTLHLKMLENAVDASDGKLDNKYGIKRLVFEWSVATETNPPHVAAQEKVLEDLRPHSNVRELKVCNYSGNMFPTWLTDGQLENLSTLTLEGCLNCKILDIGQLPNLRELSMKGLHGFECLSANNPPLQKLEISDCPELKNLPGVLPDLRVLEIGGCRFLKDLPMAPSLESMILVDNSSLENWSEGYENQSLLKLKINDCPKLSELPKVFSLQDLEISGCDMLTTLPYSHFENLHFLLIKSCSATILNSISSASSLQILSVQDCPGLTSLPDDGLPTSLTCLYIESCPEVSSLGPNDILKRLSLLQILHIRSCPLITSLPEDGVPSSLEQLIIRNCPLLYERCQNQNGGGLDWPKISLIPCLDIGFTPQPTEAGGSPAKNPSLSQWFNLAICCTGTGEGEQLRATNL